MWCRPGAVVGVVAALLGAPAPPGENAAPRFRLVEARNAETLERDLHRAATDHYRVLATSQGSSLDGKPRLVALMERIAADHEVYEYAVLSPSGDLEDHEALSALNALGAAGYRVDGRNILARKVHDWWLPERTYDAQITLVLERGATPARYTYDSIRFSSIEAFQSSLAERWREGYEVLALVNSARRVRAVLGRSLDEVRDETPAARASREAGNDRYRMLFNARRHGMREALKRSARHGYRVVASTDQSVLAPAMVLLERLASPPDTYSYKVVSRPVARHRKDKLERKLNRRTARGFRVVPSGLTETDLAIERPPGNEPQPWQYRVLSSRESPGLPSALEQALDDGYGFVALFSNALETVALVEKASIERRER